VRYSLFAVSLLAACTADNPLYVGDGDGGAGGGDAGQSDGSKHDQSACPPSCHDDLAADDLSTAPPDDLTQPPSTDLARTCTPYCQHCTFGGACCPGAPNGGCCGAGEWCDNGACRCGDGPACTTNGDRCAQGGIIQFGMCGSVCCGSFNHPCPL
jgi:hypothetical protein